MLEARVARTREGHPQHTALLGEWAIGKTTLLMHWRRRLEAAGDRVVLTMAYPQSRDDFLAALAGAIAAEADGGWTTKVDLEVGLDVGLAEARLRKPVREVDKELRALLRRAARVGDRHAMIVLVDDVDLITTPGDRPAAAPGDRPGALRERRRYRLRGLRIARALWLDPRRPRAARSLLRAHHARATQRRGG